MSGNSILNKARYSDNTDEWYTDYDTVAEEVFHYASQFYGKTVLCNCDDPYESAFAKYFLKNFGYLKLKKLICTSYKGSRIVEKFKLQDNERCDIDNQYAYVMIVEGLSADMLSLCSDEAIDAFLRTQGNVQKLKGNGDFRSDECVAYLKEADIVCTNPPFSKFADLFSLLVKYKKKYLLIGNQNAITYKEIFPYIKSGQAWIGYRFGDMAFKVPDDTAPRKTRFWIDESGQKWRSLGNAMWLTNLDTERKHLSLELTSKYNPEQYPKYDNYDAINVKKVSEIPMDYPGIMGVPLTYLKYHNEEQFEIVGEANHGSDNEFDLFKPKIDGKEIFKRILIKKKRCPVQVMDFRILDLFCGAGGMSYGMEQNRHFTTEVALDFNEKALQTFKYNMPATDTVFGDINDDAVKATVIELCRKRRVNMIIGGPPCQGFSLKGKKLGLDDPRNFLFNEYLRFVEILQPEVFVIENVKALLSTSAGWFKDQIIDKVSAMGYFVEHGVLTASDFGVPQARQRAIFICSKKKSVPLPVQTSERPVTVRDAIFDLAYLNSNEGAFEQEYTTEPTSDYQIRMRKGSKKLFNHKASNHAKIAIKKLEMIPAECGKEHLPAELVGNQQFSGTWGRLKWDEPSPTIDTRFDASSNGTNNHPFLHRAITPREAARIQSFDDKFVFIGPKLYIRQQIGNAVPPLMAKAIADQICRVLGAE
ncbi:MAG: DNA (cytosine-5-)-methyltransferase [Clostridiales bacterium]|jgi:DNA-cytosine methyltransferase|nr:DNA (cytosine-5-)-methyltransferase [Clostridiales bacterium]